MKNLYAVKIQDPRWRLGEVGVELENNFPELYDHKLKFEGTVDTLLFGHVIKCVRVFYFRKEEVELVSTGSVANERVESILNNL